MTYMSLNRETMLEPVVAVNSAARSVEREMRQFDRRADEDRQAGNI